MKYRLTNQSVCCQNMKKGNSLAGSSPINRNLSFSCLNKFNQLFHIIKIIIITNDSFTMISDSSFFIFLKAVKKFLYTISFYKQCKTIWLDFVQ